METKHRLCERCLIRGYSPDLCRVHYKKLIKMDDDGTLHDTSLGPVGRTAVLGAGVGALATGMGLAAIPFVGVKAALGIALSAKVCAGGGIIGAGVNMARRAAKKQEAARPRKKHQPIVF